MKKIQALLGALACCFAMAGAAGVASADTDREYIAEFHASSERSADGKEVYVLDVPKRAVADDEVRVVLFDMKGIYEDTTYKKGDSRAYSRYCNRTDACWSSYHASGEISGSMATV